MLQYYFSHIFGGCTVCTKQMIYYAHLAECQIFDFTNSSEATALLLKPRNQGVRVCFAKFTVLCCMDKLGRRI